MSLLLDNVDNKYNNESFQTINQPATSSSSSSFSTFSIIIIIILLIYVIFGILAFIMSLSCFAYGGSINDKALGLLLAWITGPFYWLYFIYNNEYCTRNPPPVYYSQPPNIA